MKDILEDIKRRFKEGDILTRLIYLNGGGFLIMFLFQIIYGLITGASFENSNDIFASWTGVPTKDMFEFLIKPYTLLTHMFVHADIFHIVGNMLVLYFSGKLFLNYFSKKQFLGLYFLGGITAAFTLIILTSISPWFTSHTYAVGASAAVMAIVIGITSYSPNTKIMLFGLFPVKLMWIGIVYVASDLVQFEDTNSAGHLAHLAGAGVGYWFSASFKQGKDITKGINKFIDGFLGLFTSKPKMKVVYNQEKVKNMSDEQYNTHKKTTQKEIDAILDKISSSGYSSLSKREKDILFQHSNKK